MNRQLLMNVARRSAVVNVEHCATNHERSASLSTFEQLKLDSHVPICAAWRTHIRGLSCKNSDSTKKKSEKRMTAQTFSRSPTEGRTIAVVGDVYRFLATGEETNGKYAAFEAIVPPGGGPPPHVHSREDESFYVIDGEITFTINDQKTVATAGMFAQASIGVTHSFKNESNKPAKMIISVFPAGLEKMFFESGVPVAQGATTAFPPTMDEITKMMSIAPNYGIEIKLPGH
jgi:quercetin dioxygenase-like cupin family protein